MQVEPNFRDGLYFGQMGRLNRLKGWRVGGLVGRFDTLCTSCEKDSIDTVILFEKYNQA